MAAQLYELADSFSRGDIDKRRLQRSLALLAERVLSRCAAESFEITVDNAAFPAIAREMRWG